jgi:hypothetical protein
MVSCFYLFSDDGTSNASSQEETSRKSPSCGNEFLNHNYDRCDLFDLDNS